MSTSLKIILIIVAILLAVALVVFAGPEVELGSIFAALAGGFAAFKAKLFNSPTRNVEEQITNVDTEKLVKRSEWTFIKEEYDSKLEALKARMDYLDYRSKLLQEYSDRDAKEPGKDPKLTENEILKRLKKLS